MGLILGRMERAVCFGGGGLEEEVATFAADAAQDAGDGKDELSVGHFVDGVSGRGTSPLIQKLRKCGSS